jgi:hypothetical protein
MSGLISYWRLNEESGTRYDAIGAKHLTDNNTVGFAAGKKNNAASSVAANNEWLSKAAVVMPDSYTIAAWIYVDSILTGGYLACQNEWATSNQFYLYSNGNIFHLCGDGLGGFKYAGVAPVNPGVPEWHLLIAWLDVSDKTPHLSVDGQAEVVNTGALPALYRTAAPFIVGQDIVHPNIDLKIDEVGVWSRVLTSAERIELRAAGAGKFLNAAGDDFE